MSFIILYTDIFHEENNFQNKSKAGTALCLILEQSMTWRRCDGNNPIYTEVASVGQGQAPHDFTFTSQGQARCLWAQLWVPRLANTGQSDALCLLNTTQVSD